MMWNGFRWSSSARAASLLVLLLLLPGCAAASLASLGTLAGMAATVVTTGADVYHLGKLDSVELAREDEVITAVRQTAEELHLASVRETWESDHKWYVLLVDDENSTIGITVEGRTATMTRARINVGVFGSEPSARLILLRLREHLPMAPSMHPTTHALPEGVKDPREPTSDDDARQTVRKPKT